MQIWERAPTRARKRLLTIHTRVCQPGFASHGCLPLANFRPKQKVKRRSLAFIGTSLCTINQLYTK